jgi:predicted naringenin-chalcone synthase
VRIAAVGSSLPEHYYDQEKLLAAFREQWAERYHNVDRIERLHRNVMVGGRHLALPIHEYLRIETGGQANEHWIRVAEELGAKAVLTALDCAGLGVDEVDAFYFTTVTGIATPSIDARLMNRLGLPSDVKRVPIFGLGCLAGAAGIARSADYLKGHPDEVVVLLSVELCSLTLQRSDLSVENLIGSGLFGDGAAAAVLVGENRTPEGPRVAASRSSFYPDSERVMGWVGEGLQDRPVGRSAGDGSSQPAPGRRCLFGRAWPDKKRYRGLGLTPRRAEGPRGHAGGPGAAGRCPRKRLEDFARGRQSVVNLGVVGVGRDPRFPPPGR